MATPVSHDPLHPARLAHLSRGLLQTLRCLNSRDGGWGSDSSGRLLAIQRFFREFEGWIREVERIAAASQPQASAGDVRLEPQESRNQAPCADSSSASQPPA